MECHSDLALSRYIKIPARNFVSSVKAQQQRLFQLKLRLTERQLLPRVRWERESQDRHGGDEHARHDQVEEVVERAPADADDEGDVQVGLRAAVVEDLVALAGDA